MTPALTDLAALEAAHTERWHLMSPAVRHLSEEELSTRRQAAETALDTLMRPVLDAQPVWQTLCRLGYAPARVHARPYRTAAGQWMLTGLLDWARDHASLSVAAPTGTAPTLAGALGLEWTLSPYASGGEVAGGAGMRARLHAAATRVAVQLRRDALHEQVTTIGLHVQRRQHPHTHHEGVNYCPDGLARVHHTFRTADLLG